MVKNLQGFVVVCIDNRGSLHRGAGWEAYLRGRLGQVELTDHHHHHHHHHHHQYHHRLHHHRHLHHQHQVELTDQVEVLHWLASVTGYLDLTR